jgi:hypothetical protein
MLLEINILIIILSFRNQHFVIVGLKNLLGAPKVHPMGVAPEL